MTASILYPDVFVTRDAVDLRTDMIFRSPETVIEVLSPSTRVHDRDAELRSTGRFPACASTCWSAPDTREVRLFTPKVDNHFTVRDLTGYAEMRLESIDCVLRADEVFEGAESPT